MVPVAEEQPDTEETPPQAVPSRTLLHLPLRELLVNGALENRGMILVGTAYGVLWEAGLFNAFWDRLASSVYGPGLIRDTAESLIRGELPSLARAGVFLVGIVGLLALVRVLSMIWSGVRLHEFRLSRVGDDLRTEYGLLTRVTTTIPLRRVQTLTIREAPLQRLVNRMSVSVETAGGHGGAPEQGQGQGRGSQRPREPLAPIIRREAVPALVREVLPAVDLDALDWQPLHPRAFRRALKPAMLLAIVTSAPFLFWFGWRGIVVLPVFVAWLGIVTRKHVQRMHWAATGDVVVLRSGWLWRHVKIAPIAKIQTVSCAESPFDRRAVMASLSVDTAGSRSHQISIPYLARHTARALFEKLSTRAAETAFRW
jgi:putative membrane protein